MKKESLDFQNIYINQTKEMDPQEAGYSKTKSIIIKRVTLIT